MREGEALDRGEVTPEPAFHPAAAALFRGEPGQEAGGARHRPALDLCLDHPGAAGPRLCPARQAALRARGPRPAGHRLPDQLFRALRRIQFHRRPRRTSSTTSPAGAIDWKEVLRDFWQRLLGRGRRHQGPDDQRGARQRSTRSSGRHFFPRRRRRATTRALCPVCGAGRLGLKLGKFGAFIGCSNYPECRYTRPLGDREPTARPTTPSPTPSCSAPIPATGLPVTLQEGPLRPLRPARRGRRRATSRSASSLPRGHEAGRCRSRHRAAAAVAAARARPPPGNRRADHRRDRPLRPLYQARHDLQIARPPTTTC